MTTTMQTIRDDSITILPEGQIEVREATIVLQSGVPDPGFPAKYHRYVLMPGDDLTGKAQRIVDVANTVWTAEILSAWRTNHPKVELQM